MVINVWKGAGDRLVSHTTFHQAAIPYAKNSWTVNPPEEMRHEEFLRTPKRPGNSGGVGRIALFSRV